MRHNLVLLKTLDEALSDDATARVGVALSTDGVLELQGLLEKLQIVERREAVYVRGPRVGRLREFPALGAVIDAFAASMVHRGGPCALLIREAVLLAPARFGLTADRMEEAFDGLKLIARPIAGTTDKFSTPTTTATISLTGSVMAGRATALTGARKASLLASLGAFDAFCMHLMHLIYECLHYRAALGFAADNANAEALEQALAGAFARPSIIENAKHVIALFYKPSDVLEGHIDTSKVATFITTRTRNADRRVLLNLADMGDDALKYEVAYDRWDVFFFPAAVWHQTSPIPTEREIVNLFY